MSILKNACSVLTMAGALLGLQSHTLAVEPPAVKSPLDLTVKKIDGEETSLSVYKGKVVLIVNVASKCGLTPQYEGLQAIYDTYGERGLVILGFPANNFMGQEPGEDAEIKMFCSTKYHVTFPMFSKVSVKGDDIAPLYAWLTSEKTNPGYSGDIEWNFAKFVVNHEGSVVGRFHPKVKPDSKEVIDTIEAALAAAERAAHGEDKKGDPAKAPEKKE